MVHSQQVVIIDFSTFCGFQVLTLAVQTHEGRAIPVYFDCLTYPIEFVGSQNIFIIDTLKRFIEQFKIKPAFVLDRGFTIPSLIQFFEADEIVFYVRCKKTKLISIPDGNGGDTMLSAQALKHTNDTTIKAYGDLQLRLIKSAFNRKKHKEPWYILTNDFSSTRKEIITIYYHRFEIEETFKDLKHVFGLKKFFIKRMMSFKVLLWCMIFC
ncbi:MAG: transposase [Candidatus Roizmanbacteria bacterium]